ncbi:MAG: hypothetical protein AVO35_09025 [Candidatus Aegiribacteria sp. MLS_C]|nr:MAG: hypothetical protein AVO35_09025 [Candidatus Aegiribacteria sp. MLS_C]
MLMILAMTALTVVSCGEDSGGSRSPGEPSGSEDRSSPVDGDSAAVDEGVSEEGDRPEEQNETPTTSSVSSGPEGEWNTTMGRMTIEVDAGGTVTGLYPLGTIEGVIDGNTLDFVFDEGTLTGTGSFGFSDDFSSFSGVQVIEGAELVWEGSRI